MKQHHTIRHNKFDKQSLNKTAIYIDENGVRHSMNKRKNWELLNDPNIKQIKNHLDITEEGENTAFTDKFPDDYGSGMYYEFKKGKQFISINNEKTHNNVEINDLYPRIELPFSKHEYPIDREFHVKYESPCKACFRHGGRIWQLKGLGNKSTKKNKGMRKEMNKINKNIDYQFNFKCL